MLANFTAKVIEVIEVVVTEGDGKDGNPYRRVVYYTSLDGEVLARYDQWKEEEE